MPFAKTRSLLYLTPEEMEYLKGVVGSRSCSQAEAQRARIILSYSRGTSVSTIARDEKVSRPTVERCIDKALSLGVKSALNDLQRSGRPRNITDEAKAWVVGLACKKPAECGYDAERWTLELLAKYIQSQAKTAGHLCLVKANKTAVKRILDEQSVKLNKNKYYLVKKHPEEDVKVAQVLQIYQEIDHTTGQPREITDDRKDTALSFFEKSGIQVVGGTADLSTGPKRHAVRNRDYEYDRVSTLSLLAGIDLYDGYIIALVRERHRGMEFIEFLEETDRHYPDDWKIRIILSDHMAHTSKETIKWMKQRPQRFEFIFMPKNSAWLNMSEILFSKMTRAFLRSLQVNSEEELKKRIEKYLLELNAEPVAFPQTNKAEDA